MQINDRAHFDSIRAVLLSTPNIIGYVRIILIFVFVVFALCCPVLAVCAISLSAVLDILDGQLARALKQETNFGRLLDMVADRFLEAGVLIVLCVLYPRYWIFFTIILFLDIISHLFILVKSHQETISHKTVIQGMPGSLRVYYGQQLVLSFTCAFYEALLFVVYLLRFFSLTWLYVVFFICLPGFLFKVYLNVLQLKYAACRIAAADVKSRL